MYHLKPWVRNLFDNSSEMLCALLFLRWDTSSPTSLFVTWIICKDFSIFTVCYEGTEFVLATLEFSKKNKPGFLGAGFMVCKLMTERWWFDFLVSFPRNLGEIRSNLTCIIFFRWFWFKPPTITWVMFPLQTCQTPCPSRVTWGFPGLTPPRIQTVVNGAGAGARRAGRRRSAGTGARATLELGTADASGGDEREWDRPGEGEGGEEVGKLFLLVKK